VNTEVCLHARGLRGGRVTGAKILERFLIINFEKMKKKRGWGGCHVIK